MKWIKYTLTTTTSAIDLVSASFDEIGIQGIEIEDNIPLTEEDTKGMFIDILPEIGEDKGEAKISFYLEPEEDIEGILQKANAALDDLAYFVDLGPRTWEKSETEDKDWINNWKEFFKPFTVEDILIKPTWEEIPKNIDYKTLIQIDPGTAFGTGSHETTQLCIKQLRKYLQPEMEVMDVGTGSGILGIAALKMGAAHVFATDLDDNAILSVYENLESNQIAKDKFDIVCGNIIDDESVKEAAGDEKYDIVLANILAPIIILLQKDIARHMKKGGLFITSGIIDMKEEEVRAALEANADLEIVEVNYQGEWVNITARKK